MELLVLGVFVAELIVMVALGLPVWAPLAVGLAIFWGYGLARGHSPAALERMTASGVKTAAGVLEAFVLIGILTALWRASGTISQIVVMTSSLVGPTTIPVASFLLCALVSYLIGSSFATAATMGVVCGTMTAAMDANLVLAGGAILSGCYFGDRCSPVSSSALLVRTVTDTRLQDNLRAMMATAAVPLVVSVVAYAALGSLLPASGAAASGLADTLRAAYGYHLVALLPAVAILVMPLAGMGMKRSMAISSVVAALVCLFVQHLSPRDLLVWCVAGYTCPHEAVAGLMSGGGLASMVSVSAVVCLSSSYAGIFDETGLLGGVRGHVDAIARRYGPFSAVLAVGIPASMIACNQTLAIMLTQQLCEGVETDARSLAIDLENGPVVISPLIPWSIAGTTILGLAQAPTAGILTAIYLWLIPIWHLFCKSLKFFEKQACKPAEASV